MLSSERMLPGTRSAPATVDTAFMNIHFTHLFRNKAIFALILVRTYRYHGFQLDLSRSAETPPIPLSPARVGRSFGAERHLWS